MRIFKTSRDGRIYWHKLSEAVLFAGKGLRRDIEFKWNYRDGEHTGVKLNALYESLATNAAEAEREATALAIWIGQDKYRTVFVDLGDIITAHLSTEEKEDIAKVFKNKISNVEIIGVRGVSAWEKAKATPGMYGKEILRRI